MNAFSRSVARVFHGAGQSFINYPVTMAAALLFALTVLVRIQMDYAAQQPYAFLFDCLLWTFALAALLGLAVVTAARSRFAPGRAFLIANLLAVLTAIIAFLLLYFCGSYQPTWSAYPLLTELATLRMAAGLLVSLVAFIWLAAYPRTQSDCARSFFMVHKALVLAILYGGVVLAGASGVAGAVQVLIYPEMSEKVYQYIGTLAGLFAFTVFVGYFPNFRPGQDAERRERVQSQPRFVEILFDYILVPLTLAFTLVLLIWAVKTLIGGLGAEFNQLAAITTSYTLIGIWLHFMVTHHESAWALWYRKFFPIAALVILAFEAWALIVQLSDFGLKDTSYGYLLLAFFAAAACILLLLRQMKAHAAIFALIGGLAVFAVLPVVNLQNLPLQAQTNRLEKLLTAENILQGETLVPVASEPEQAVKEKITDAVFYLANAGEDAKLPGWFDSELNLSDVFESKLGFVQTWPEYEAPGGGSQVASTYLALPAAPLDVSGYRWALSPQVAGDQGITFAGELGRYTVNWTYTEGDKNLPLLKIDLDGRMILEEDFAAYIAGIEDKFPPGAASNYQPQLEDMSYLLTTPEVSVLLVFSNVEINIDLQNNNTTYWLNLNALYLQEKI
jgi:hypothetical protein